MCTKMSSSTAGLLVEASGSRDSLVARSGLCLEVRGSDGRGRAQPTEKTSGGVRAQGMLEVWVALLRPV